MTKGHKAVFLNKREHLLTLLLYTSVIFIAYSIALNGTWAMDDLLLNKSFGISDIRTLIGFRKIAYLTFLINQAITPLSPAGFRVFNILLHIINSFLVYLIARKTISFISIDRDLTIRKARGRNKAVQDNRPFFVALLSGLVFGLHPININAVSYVIQRMAALSAFFSLLSILFYISASESVSKSKGVLFYVLCGLSIIAGIFSKENAVMAFPLILLYDYIFLSGLDIKRFIKRAFVPSGIGVIILAFASYLLNLHHAFIDLFRSLINPNQPLTDRGWMAVDVYWTPLQHLLTEFRVVSRYIFLLFVPLPKFFVFDWWGYPVSKNLVTPVSTIFAFIFLLSLLLFSVLKIRRFPLLSFGILWYIIAISLESFFALGSDLYFEHRNYLPVSCLFFGIIGQIDLSFKPSIERKKIWITVLIMVLIFGPLTFFRNLVWRDSFTLWGDTLNKVPYNIRSLKAIGNAYYRVYDFKNAEVYFLQAIKESSIRRSPQLLDESVFALGMIYLYRGEYARAKELIDKYEYVIESYRPKILKGLYYSLNEDFDAALSEFDKVNNAGGVYKTMLFTLKGDAYRSKGLFDKAMQEYYAALKEDVSFAPAYHGIGVTYMIKRDIRQAKKYFEMALRVEPDNKLVLSDMSDLMLIKGESHWKAFTYAQMAISKNPPLYQPYLAMGNVLLAMGREEEAGRFYQEASLRGAKEYMIILNKARLYYLRGDYKNATEYLLRLKNLDGLPLRMRNLNER